MTATLNDALLAVQKEAPTLQKTAINPHFRSKYVPLDAVHEAVMPLLNKHGLVWVTLPSYDDGVGPTLRYSLTHVESGGLVKGSMPLLPQKSDPQGQGSAITYARRYALMAVLGLVADEDDDGNAASGQHRRNAKPLVEPQERPLAEKVKDLPGTTEVVPKVSPQALKAHVVPTIGEDAVAYIKKLRAEAKVSPQALKAHVVATHGKDTLTALTTAQANAVEAWLRLRKEADAPRA